jgi:thiamine-monophosphate kinase
VRLGDLTEAQILAHILPRLPRGTSTELGPGDDAAILAAPGGRVVVSTDVLVEDRHFRRDWSTGADVGWRAAMHNLADIAAMGATPTALTVALAAPRDLPIAWLGDLADGLAEACAPLGVGVVGGDLSSADTLTVAVTALGTLDDAVPLLRSGARPGDVVALAGQLGWSAAGLDVLRASAPTGTGPMSELVGRAVRGYRRPEPPLPAGPAASRAGATAMMDISDGLLLDARRMAEASGVIVHLDAQSPALARPAARLAPLADVLGRDATAWVLTGGEDHALLATFPQNMPLTSGFAPIGRVAGAGGSAPGVLLDGRVPAGVEGWDHFSGTPGQAPR